MSYREFVFLLPGQDAPQESIAGDLALPACALQLSNWRNNQTPGKWKRDTATEVAFAFSDDPKSREWLASDIVRTYYDADGVLAAWTLLYPEEARARRDLFVAAAEAASFDEWPKSQDGLWLAAALQTIGKQADSHEQAFETAFDLLPDLADQLPRFRKLWAPRERALAEGRMAVDEGRIRVSSVGRIGIIRHDPGFPELPGPLISRLLLPKCWRFLLLFEQADGRSHARYELPRYAWADTIKRPKRDIPDLVTTATALGAQWTHEALPGLTALARTIEPIDFDLEDILERVSETDMEAAAGL